MTARAPAQPAPRMLVTFTDVDLRALVLDIVQAAVDEVARPAPPALLDSEQTARELGISTAHLAKMRREGLPVIMIGEAFRYELPRVLEWLRQR